MGVRPLVDRVAGRAHRELAQRRYRRRIATSAVMASRGSLRPLLRDVTLPSAPGALPAVAARYTRGWFDLLGSGWRPFLADPEGDRPYPALSWHVDPLSGHRWDPSAWHRAVERTPGPGIDIKVPWELGRLQHLPQLALASVYARNSESGFDPDDPYKGAVESHLMDFITHNPVGFGVQWGCAMDAGIRVANMLLAFDVLAQFESHLRAEAEAALTASVQDHARFIVANLEWTASGRTNHYLADICGLLWAAAHLEGDAESDSWLCFAARLLQEETKRQFDRDGAGTEGSTSYHRLSAEMVVWSTALLLSLPEDRVRGLAPNSRYVREAPLALRRTPLAASDVSVTRTHLGRVARMVDLTGAVTRADGAVTQIGDNDNGRFVKPAPPFHPLSVRDSVDRFLNLAGYEFLPAEETYWWEDPLDHSHLTSVVAALFGEADGTVDAALLGGYVRAPARRPPGARALQIRVGTGVPASVSLPNRRLVSIEPGGGDLLEGLETKAFVPFGLYLWRSSRLYLTVRCGRLGQEGRGGHDHRDQLAVELVIDGVPWWRDPGSFTYTRDPDLRNAYRSAAAHSGPAGTPVEDWTTNPDLFALDALAMEGSPRHYEERVFVGERSDAQSRAVRRIELHPDRLLIEDFTEAGPTGTVVLRSADDASAVFPCSVPFSPGYGWQER